MVGVERALSDDIRSYWKGDTGSLPGLASGLLASANLFERRGRRPWSSINFVTSHDGFTLADLYAYNDKHNEANQEGNADGHPDNLSWNCGTEGVTEDPEIEALRVRMRRGAMVLLMASASGSGGGGEVTAGFDDACAG